MLVDSTRRDVRTLSHLHSKQVGARTLRFLDIATCLCPETKLPLMLCPSVVVEFILIKRVIDLGILEARQEFQIHRRTSL